MISFFAVTVLLTSVAALPQRFDYRNEGVNPNRGGFGHITPHVPHGPVIQILRDERSGPTDGNYNFIYETEDGLTRSESGSPTGPAGTVASQGSWSFVFPDGTPAHFSFVADENGYRVESPLLPVGPAIPHHAQLQIEKAAHERAQGIIHDGQYHPQATEQHSFRQSPQRYQ